MDKGVFYEKIARRPIIEKVVTHNLAGVDVPNSNHSTVQNWIDIWVKNIKTNLQEFSYFNKDHSVKTWFFENVNNPCVLVGAGPSLEKNIEVLRECKSKKIAVISSAHAYMYLEKEGIVPDFVVMLDAGEQWAEYLGRGGHLELPLLVDWACDTDQLKRWKGPVYFFQSSFDKNQEKEAWTRIKEVLENSIPAWEISVKGHVVGAMLHIATEILRSSDVIFVGCDYSFNNSNFYPFSHKDIHGLDQKSIPTDICGEAVDIFGEKMKVSKTYSLFKCAIDSYVQEMGGVSFVNATESGILGAYREGNLKNYQYLMLEDALPMVCARRETRWLAQ